MKSPYKYGKHVKANFSGDKVELGHLVQDAHDVGGETKYGVVAMGDNTVRPMAYTAESIANAGGFFTDAN